MKNLIKLSISKYLIIAVIFGSFLAFGANFANAYVDYGVVNSSQNTEQLTCNILRGINPSLCGSTVLSNNYNSGSGNTAYYGGSGYGGGTTGTGNSGSGSSSGYQSAGLISPTNIVGSLFGYGNSKSGSAGSSALGANLSSSLKKTYGINDMILVRAPKSSEIYRIKNGKRFLIPNMKVFYSYDFSLNDVISMSKEKILSYPRVKVIKVVDNKNNYYLTDGGMTRKVPNQKVFDSYGDRAEDIVTINKTEFSMYPTNYFIFNEDVHVIGTRVSPYRITLTTKKLMSEWELRKFPVRDTMVAPVNQTEFDFYATEQLKPLAQSKSIWPF